MRKRILMLAMGVMLIGALIGGSTFAFFNASAEPSSNTFTAGTLNIDITDTSGNHLSTPIMEYDNMAPGDLKTYYFNIKNTGSLPEIYQWAFTRRFTSAKSQGQKDGLQFAKDLQIKMEQKVGTSWQLWGDERPDNAINPSPRTVYDLWNIANPDFQDRLSPGDSHQFRFTVTLPLAVTNADQGATVRVSLAVNATQEQNNGLVGSYYSTFDYAHKAIVGLPALTRVDPTINYDWDTTRPLPGYPHNNVAVVWNGFLVPDWTEAYTFTARSDDGVKMFIDTGSGMQPIINFWSDHAPTNYVSNPISLTAGHKYPIKVEWYQHMGRAVAQLYWSSPHRPNQIVPQVYLYQH